MYLGLSQSISRFIYFPFLLVLYMYFFLIILQDTGCQLLPDENTVYVGGYVIAVNCNQFVQKKFNNVLISM